MTVSKHDFIVDPLSNLDLEPLRYALESREIVLHAADYDLRMLRRGLNFTASKIFDTVDCGAVAWNPRIQSGCAGEALFRCRASQTFAKGKLGAATAAAADAEIRDGRRALFVATCRKIRGRAWSEFSAAIGFGNLVSVQSSWPPLERERIQDELWRIGGAGALDPHTGAVLRALWQWREAEAEMADRPPFHILQNRELLKAAESFTSGHVPDYKHFSARRRQTFREAAKIALQSPQSEWPVMRRRSGSRPTAEMRRRADQLRERRDKSAGQLGLERSFIASRGALEAIAADPARATALLVPWQRELIGMQHDVGDMSGALALTGYAVELNDPELQRIVYGITNV